MPTERIQIIVSENGTRTVRRRIEQVGTSARQASRGIDILQRAIVALGGVAVIGALVRVNDSFIEFGNRIRVVTEGVDEFRFASKQLLEVSNETFASVEGSSRIFQRMQIALSEYGVRVDETIDLVKTLNQASVIQGATTQEATGAMIQLAQGLGSGRVSGEEFRSVAEQLTILLGPLAEAAGVARGELRQFANDQLLTTDLVVQALRDVAPEFERLFGGIQVTVDRALTVLNNNFQFFIGDVNNSLGIFDALANAILVVANNLETLGNVFAVILAFVAPGAIAAGLGLIAAALGAIVALIAANPFLALAGGIAALATATLTFGREVAVTEDGLVTLADVGIATFQRLQSHATSLGQTISTYVKSSIEELGESFPGTLSGISDIFESARLNIVGFIASLDTRLDFFINQAIVRFEQFAIAIGEALNLASPEAIAQRRGALERFQERIANEQQTGIVSYITGIIKDETDAIAAAARQLQKDREAAYTDPANFGGPPTQITPEITRRGGAKPPSFSELIKDLENENAILKVNVDQRAVLAEQLAFEDRLKRQLTGTEEARVQALVLSNEAQDRQNQLLSEIIGPEQELILAIADLNQLYNAGAISLEQYTDKLEELQEALDRIQNKLDPLSQKLVDFGKGAADVGSQIGDAITKGFATAEDSMVSFLQTGKFNFTDFANSLIADLARIAIRSQITGPLSSFLGGIDLGGLFGGGGAASIPAGTSPIPQFADGGSVYGAGTSRSDGILARLSNGEFVVNAAAASRNRDALDAINNGGSIRGSGGGTSVTINDLRTNSEGQGTAVEESEDANGQRQVVVSILDVVDRGLKGGRFNGTFSNKFGVTQQVVRR